MVAAALHSIHLPLGGEPRQVKPAGKYWTLDEMKELIGGGYVECIGIDDNYLMLLDEDGKIKGQLPNQLATFYAAPILQASDFIVGHAVLVLRSEMD